MTMKKKILFMMTMLAGVGTAMADNVTVENLTVPIGGQATLNVNYQFDVAEQYSGWQFSLVLPEGLSTVKDAKGNPSFTTGSCYDASYTFTSSTDGTTDDFVALSLQSSPITGTTGVLISIPIASADNLTAGSTFNATLKGIQLGNVDGVHTTFIDDVNFTITIGEPDDGRLKFFETSTTLPSYTAGEKADVTVYRTIKANEWSTIVLPFNLTKANANAVFGDDVQLAKFVGYTIDYGDDEENVIPLGITINLSDYTIPARGNLAGGTPVFIKTSKDITEPFQLDNVTLTEGVKDVESADADYDIPGKFTGTLVKSVIPADGLFLNGNKFWYSTGKTTVKAFRCWLELGAVLDKETDFGARILLNFLDDETTGIQDNKRESINNKHYYDIQGRRINGQSSMGNGQMKKGVYIVNGKKVIK